MKFSCVSISSEIANCEHNCQQIKRAIKEAEITGSDFIIFSELSLSGYSCGDIFFNEDLYKHNLSCLFQIVEYSSKKDIIIVIGLPILHSDGLYNCAAVIYRGEIKGIVPKTNLANVGEAYEKRWFKSYTPLVKKTIMLNGKEIPFGQPMLFELEDIVFGVEIGEDLWSPISQSSLLCNNGAQVIFNLSSCIETVPMIDRRKEIIKTASFLQKSIYVYCSGGNGESTTDGVYSNYKAIYKFGDMVAESLINKNDDKLVASVRESNLALYRARFKSSCNENTNNCFIFVRIDKKITKLYSSSEPKQREPFLYGLPIDEVCSRVSSLQQIALQKKIDYTQRGKIVIGVSGGLDSTIALMACVALYKKQKYDLSDIIGISMPGPGTTKRTFENSVNLMQCLGISSSNISITDSVKKHLQNIGHKDGAFDITYEQTQSRERTKILMDLANQYKGIVIGTGDLSEFALGWMSYSGDQISMYAINCGIPKTIIRHLANWYYENSAGELRKVLRSIIETPISPELLPVNENGEQNQSTEALVGPYIIHDFFLYHFLHESISIHELYQLACDTFTEYSTDKIKLWLKNFVARFFSRQFKRTCFSDGVQVFDVGLSPRGYWRMPSDVSDKQWLEEIKNEQSN